MTIIETTNKLKELKEQLESRIIKEKEWTKKINLWWKQVDKKRRGKMEFKQDINGVFQKVEEGEKTPKKLKRNVSIDELRDIHNEYLEERFEERTNQEKWGE